MKQRTSIAQAAVDLQISERSAWRWLRSGRIEKRKDEDGRLVFVLTSDVTDNATTDSHDMSDSVKSVSSDIKSYRRQRKKMSVEAERINIVLDCIKALYILKTEAAYQVMSYQGFTKIKWVAGEAKERGMFWMEVKRILNNTYGGIKEGVKGKDDLKGLWSELLKVRTAWDREQSAMVQELERLPDRESQLDSRFARAELAGLATPWVGVKERIFWYTYQLWFIVMALTLLRQRTGDREPR